MITPRDSPFEHVFQPLGIEHPVEPSFQRIGRGILQALLHPLGQGTEAAREHTLQPKRFALQSVLQPCASESFDGAFALAFQVAAEVLVETDGFEIDQANAVISGVAQEVELAEAAKLVDPQIRKVSFLLLADVGVLSHGLDGRIDFGHRVVV